MRNLQYEDKMDIKNLIEGALGSEFFNQTSEIHIIYNGRRYDDIRRNIQNLLYLW